MGAYMHCSARTTEGLVDNLQHERVRACKGANRQKSN